MMLDDNKSQNLNLITGEQNHISDEPAISDKLGEGPSIFTSLTGNIKNYLKRKFTGIENMVSSPLHLRAYVGDGVMLTETFFKRKIYVSTSDVSVAPHIIYDGTWEPWVTSFFQSRLKPGDSFIDIGANCGFFSLLAAHMVGNEGAVLAIEPQKDLANLINRSFRVNGFDGFSSVLSTAIGEENSTGALHTHDELSGSASLVGAFDPNKEAETVTINTLEEIIRQSGSARLSKIDFIKMDVEGYEFFAWKGMKNLLKNNGSHTMVIEFTPPRYRQLGQDPNEFLSDLIEFGYTVSRLNLDGSVSDFKSSDIETLESTNDYADLILEC